MWVKRTRDLYRHALAGGADHASIREYRLLFEDAIREFEQWLAQHPPGDDEGQHMTQPDFDTIAREDLEQRMSSQMPDNEDRKGGYALVNVLDAEAFAHEHLPGSINIPQGQEEQFESRFDKDKEIIVYGASFDSPASSGVARGLAYRGFTAVRNYAGGFKDWKEGRDTVQY